MVRHLSKPNMFFPKMSIQRMRIAIAVIRASAAQSWLDIGWGGGLLISALLADDQACLSMSMSTRESPSSVQHICGLDINATRLQEAAADFESKLSPPLKGDDEGGDDECDTSKHSSAIRHPVTSMQLYCGSIFHNDFEKQLAKGPGDASSLGWQVVTCIEVIEHLPSVHAAAEALKRILCVLRPEVAVFTTPNHEANRAIRRAVLGDEADSHPSMEHVFREEDHKFEFSRQQFRDWAMDGVAATGGRYTVDYVELGTTLPGMRSCDGSEGEGEGCRC